MTDMNPYQSPRSDVSAVRSPAPGGIGEKAILYLRGAAPWMRFLGIMGFISCGLFSFGGIFVAIVPGFWFFLRSEGVDIPAAPLERWAAVIAGLVYFACAVVWFFPSRWLYKTGARLRDYVRTGAEADLEEAFRANKAFWKFLGIITIISLALIPVFIIIGLIVAVGSALM